ncbi:MAG: hypothetical protein HS100_02400 [Anaerolineales bacterium]|nr:hypothetical protein [Anaerolineales bacterium]
MKSSTRSLILSIAILFLFGLVSGACMPRRNPPPPPPPGIELTATAQAVQIQGLTQTALAQPIIIVVTATPDPNLPAATVDPAVNPAPANPTSGVTVTVSQNTNCREGPSQEFNDVGALTPGQVAEVVGKDTFNNYWIIKLPGNPAITCWLWGQYATVNGDTSQVANVPTPTTAGPSGAPNPPTLLDAQLKCSSLSGGDYQYKVILKWADNSSNENKFTIRSSNGSVFTTPPNKTQFSFEENLPGGTNLSVTLAAANEKGESQPVGTGVFQCP